jgi:hypothetical protein
MVGMQDWPEEAKQYIQLLEEKIDVLIKELDKIKHDFDRYKKRHPPNTGVKHGKPYFFKSSNRSENPEKPGAKKGHKAHFRPMPEHIDECWCVPVNVCPDCGHRELSEKIQEIRERTFEDIPIINSVAIRLLKDRRYCRHCKKLVEAQVEWVLPGARIGLRTMLVVVWFKIHLRMTEEAIPQVLIRLFGMKISEGEVISILDQVTKAFGPYYQDLINDIREASARNIDETGWRINGMNANLWTFVSKGITLYKIAYSRGHEVPLKILGKKHKGVNIHDRFSAYKTLAKKTKNIQQDCWVHIIKNAEELAYFYGSEGEHILQVLRETYKIGKDFNHHGTDRDIKDLFKWMKDQLNQPYKSHKCNTFVCNLLKEKDNLFEFVKNPEVDGTNNAAERALRPVVIARKVSGGSRSEKGAKNYEILMSVVQTLRQNGKNLVDHGSDILLTSYG